MGNGGIKSFICAQTSLLNPVFSLQAQFLSSLMKSRTVFLKVLYSTYLDLLFFNITDSSLAGFLSQKEKIAPSKAYVRDNDLVLHKSRDTTL